MFGDKFLVAPKIAQPSAEHITYHTSVDVSVYLPVGTNWYYFWSGQPVPGEETPVTVPAADTEETVFIREGSIIPLLNFEMGRMSLLEAIDDPINLLVYPHVVDQDATGDLYLDEGENNSYLQKERTEVRFDWNGASLSVTKTLTDDNMYAKASGKYINKAQIFGIATTPVSVRNSFVSDQPNQDD